MQTQHDTAAHSLYVLYQTLPEEGKQLFLEELLGEQTEVLMLSLKNRQQRQIEARQDSNHFADICGILTATKPVSLEEMEQAISQQGSDGFDDSH